MEDAFSLERFVEAQEAVFDTVIGELNAGLKQNHWMWFIFPQLAALGRSPTAAFFGIRSIEEAAAYLDHWVLGPRLYHCVDALLLWADRRSALQIFGQIDALKLRSCLTLFDRVRPGTSFGMALQAFYEGEADERTLALLNAAR